MTAVDLDHCPGCGEPTTPRVVPGVTVHAPYCLPCTEAELGETYEQIRDRVTARVQGHAKKKWSTVSGPRERGVRR